MLTTSGGVTDGDSLKMAIEVGPGATAVATTQAAEKIYRAAKGGGHCAIDVAVRVAEGATLEWLPQETIVFEGARLKRRTVAEVEPGGSLLACEMVVLGRAASGESFHLGPAARIPGRCDGPAGSPGPTRCASKARRRPARASARPMRSPP